MIDRTPYIIVDNQKIRPIGWSPRPDHSTDDRNRREWQAFGVVDRVSISREARQKFKQTQSDEATPSTLKYLPQKPQATATALLTYSPKQLG